MARAEPLTNLTKLQIGRRLGELGSLREDSMFETQDDKMANADEPLASPLLPHTSESFAEPEPLRFGQKLLGITFLSDNREDDLPLEMLEGEDSFKL